MKFWHVSLFFIALAIGAVGGVLAERWQSPSWTFSVVRDERSGDVLAFRMAVRTGQLEMKSLSATAVSQWVRVPDEARELRMPVQGLPRQ
jgi:hypothetical protein